jgi:hypothetical protein
MYWYNIKYAKILNTTEKNEVTLYVVVGTLFNGLHLYLQ